MGAKPNPGELRSRPLHCSFAPRQQLAAFSSGARSDILLVRELLEIGNG